MVKTLSNMPELGMAACDFSLLNVTDNSNMSLSSYVGNSPFLVMFICNHCPYVIHIAQTLAEVTARLQKKGISILAINSNDIEKYPEDSPDKMKDFAIKHNFTFPYLFDSTQSVAKSYKAACTPDFFLFNKEKKLYYRGQFDDSRPGNGIEVTGKDLVYASDELLAGNQTPEKQIPSMGCNIKWKVENYSHL